MRGLNDENAIENFDQYANIKIHPGSRIVPAAEILLTHSEELDPNDPGYQKPSIRIEPIFYGTNGKTI